MTASAIILPNEVPSLFVGPNVTVRILSRAEAATTRHDAPYAFLSITDPGSEPATLALNDYCLAILRQSFHDNDYPIGGAKGNITAITSEQGREIARFVHEQYARNIRVFYVHCEAGISRSAATAAAIAMHFNGDDLEIWRNSLPNCLVYRAVIYGLKGAGTGHEALPQDGVIAQLLRGPSDIPTLNDAQTLLQTARNAAIHVGNWQSASGRPDYVLGFRPSDSEQCVVVCHLNGPDAAVEALREHLLAFSPELAEGWIHDALKMVLLLRTIERYCNDVGIEAETPFDRQYPDRPRHLNIAGRVARMTQLLTEARQTIARMEQDERDVDQALLDSAQARKETQLERDALQQENRRLNARLTSGLKRITVLRNDAIPAFGGWAANSLHEGKATILLNVEACLGEWAEEDGTVIDATPAEKRQAVIETLMHEFGHALEEFFEEEFTEARVEQIVEAFREKTTP